MRSLFIKSAALIAAVAIVVLGVPLLVLARHQVLSSANQRLGQQATSLAAEYEDQLTANSPIDLSGIERQLPGDRIIVVRPDGRRLIAGPAISGSIRSRTVPVVGGSVTVQTPAGPTDSRVMRSTLLVVILGLIAGIAAIAAAVRLARRLAQPLDSLAAHAKALGHGDFSPSEIVSGVPELDTIASVLDRSAGQINALVTIQREFASDTAHQLRTPLTGIGLRLEEIVALGHPDSATEAEAALLQVERLTGVIDSLLTRAKGDAAEPTVIDLAQLVETEADSWRGLITGAGRELTVSVDQGLYVVGRREHLVSVVHSLIDNALRHGRGTVSIRGRRTNDTASIAVADDGDGVPVGLRPHVFTRSISGGDGTGIGLALARSLANGEGGSLDIHKHAPATLILTLPVDAG